MQAGVDSSPVAGAGSRGAAGVCGGRLVGARVSLGVALVSACGAMVIGAALGGVSGRGGGPCDGGLMRTADVGLVLPAIYVVLALRAVLPLVLSSW